MGEIDANSGLRAGVLDLLHQTAWESAPWLQEGHALDDYVGKLFARAELAAWVADGRVQALVAFYANDPTRDKAFISMVAVAPARRRQKLASNLLDAVLGSLRARAFVRCELHVQKRNAPAIAMYRKFGFTQSASEGDRLTFEITL